MKEFLWRITSQLNSEIFEHFEDFFIAETWMAEMFEMFDDLIVLPIVNQDFQFSKNDLFVDSELQFDSEKLMKSV